MAGKRPKGRVLMSAKVLEFRLRPKLQQPKFPPAVQAPEFYDPAALEELKGLLEEESDELLVVLSTVAQ